MAYADAIPQQFNRIMPGQVFHFTSGTPAVNATGSELKVGRVVCAIGTADANTGTTPVKAAVAADFTALIRTSVIASFSAGQLVTTGIFRGRPFTISTVYSTDNNTSVDNHVVDLNAYFDAQYTAGTSLVAAAGTAGTLTITAEQPGESFISTTRGDTGTATNTVNDVRTMEELIRGVVAETGVSVTNSSEVSVIQDGRAFTVISEGQVAVELGTAAATLPSNAVYVAIDTTSPGVLHVAAGADRVWIPLERIRFRNGSASSTHSPVGAVGVVNLHI